MGRTRAIRIDLDIYEVEKVTDFGTYVLAMYYAKQINFRKAKKLYDATLSEASYRLKYDLPMEGLDTFEDFEAHFVPSEIEEAIFFIENEVIPQLNQETQDLLDKYGGEANFSRLFYDDSGFLDNIGLDSGEFYGDNYGIRGFFIEIKDAFSYSLANNKPFEVLVY